MNSRTLRLPKAGTTGTADAGLAFVKARVSTDRLNGGLGCLFRELPTGDKGVDGQVELVVEQDGEQVVTGKIISVQVKTGTSYFRHDRGECWSVYFDEATVNYWLSHSIPVLLVLVDLDGGECYWTRGDSEHHRTESGYRIDVPKKNVLTSAAYPDLARIAENTTEAGRRFARLEADIGVMRALERGHEIAVDVGHWWNKTSGRCDVVVGYALDDPYEGDPKGMREVQRLVAFGAASADSVEAWFPWAAADVDDEFYESISDDLYQEYLNETGTYDSETGRMIDSRGTFDDWLEARRGLKDAPPYGEAAGEIGYYRYRVRLNELGRAFLRVYQHLHG